MDSNTKRFIAALALLTLLRSAKSTGICMFKEMFPSPGCESCFKQKKTKDKGRGANLGWCTDGNKLFEGDFNGDGRTDLLCHRPSDGYKWIAYATANGEFNGTSWEQDLGWCTHVGTEIHVGDFNGDGKTDLLCHRPSDGYKWIAYANASGKFNGTSWEQDLGWCTHVGTEIHVGDFNGDGKTDLLCQRPSDGYKWIAHANGNGEFKGTSWEQDLGWCGHFGADIHIGDFNGDGRSDMLCHDTGNGDMWVALANGNGNFAGSPSWQAFLSWCSHGGAELHIGDFNGDGRDDMLCHDSNGYKWILYADRDGSFSGTNWERDLRWCNHPGSQIIVGDFNGDSKSDLLCHDRNGYKWIAYANADGNFNDVMP